MRWCGLQFEIFSIQTVRLLRTLDKADDGLLDTDLLTEEQVLLDLLKVLLSIKLVLNQRC